VPKSADKEVSNRNRDSVRPLRPENLFGKAGLSYVYFIFHFPEIAARRLTMSFAYTPNLKDEKIESLETQHEYLNILRLRHLQWMSSTNDPEIEHVHLEIAELIEKISDRYHHLLDSVQGQSDTELNRDPG
jgi:hypothetical protein